MILINHHSDNTPIQKISYFLKRPMHYNGKRSTLDVGQMSVENKRLELFLHFKYDDIQTCKYIKV